MRHLPDIVRAIALNNKIDESRDFAAIVQAIALSTGCGRSNHDAAQPRRQAGAVHGADRRDDAEHPGGDLVPHQPQDANLLKTEKYRQQIAEALFAGVMSYQEALKKVTSRRHAVTELSGGRRPQSINNRSDRGAHVRPFTAMSPAYPSVSELPCV